VASLGLTCISGSDFDTLRPSSHLCERTNGLDYAQIDFTGWLDSFQGKDIMDSSSANKGQMVKVPIGPGDEGGQGLVAGQGRGGTVAEPVIVPVPLGVNKALSAGVAPRAADGGLATQALAASFKDAPTVGTKFRIVIPPELGFGKEGGISGLGVKVPPSATLYYEVRIRAKTGKFQTGA
jgi:hypothetical protein